MKGADENMKKKGNKIRIALIVFGLATILVGCGENLRKFVANDLGRAFEERRNANVKIINDLKANGFLTEKEAASYAKSVESAFEPYTELCGEAAKSDMDVSLNHRYIAQLQYAASHYWGYGESDVEEKYPGSGDTPSNTFLGNYLYDDNPGSLGYASGHGIYSEGTGEHNKVEEKAIAVFSSKVAADINSKFDFEVYVLKPISSTSSETNNEIYLDGIVEMMNQSVDDNGNIVTYEHLNNYFMPALDGNGEPIKLIDMTKEENQVVKLTTDNMNAEGNQCGKDMVVIQAGLPQVSVTMREFSQEGFDNLMEIVGDNNRRYLLGKAGTAGANRAYLVEYPVEYINSIEDTDDTYAKVITLKSNMGVNLKTKEIIKYDSAFTEGLSTDGLVKGQPVSMEDNYYQMGGALSEAETPKSSFVVTGVGEAPIRDDIVALSGKIILRDYLEGTYLPGAIPDENWAILGRKLRVENIRANMSEFNPKNGLTNQKKLSTMAEYSSNEIYVKKSDVFARFYDNKGVMLKDSPEIYVSDLCQYSSMLSENDVDNTNYYIRPAGEKENYSKVYNPKDVGDKDKDKTENNLTKGIANVKKGQLEKIEVSGQFPGENFDTKDANNNMNNNMPFFYTMTIGTDIYKNALYSNWIASSSATNSLNWWDGWLAGKNFIYDIDTNAVISAITGVYSYEVDDSGKIIINLEDVGELQKQINEEKKAEMADNARSTFVILGYIMIGISIIFIMLWTVDTSTDLGLGLLEKATFGNWVAVKHDEDVPYVDTENRSYLTFGRLIVRCSIIAAVGIVFIVAPIFQIILSLIKAVGGIAKEFANLIGGM